MKKLCNTTAAQPKIKGRNSPKYYLIVNHSPHAITT